MEKSTNMYKVTVCNLGYENKNLQELNGYTSTLEKCLNRIQHIRRSENGRTIEGYKVTKINYDVTEEDFENEEAVNIIETTDSDRCIYILKIS